MNRLLLLALGFLIPLLAHAQNLTVTVDGNPVENLASVSGTNYDAETGKISATMQISTTNYSTVPVTVTNNGSNPIYIGNQLIAVGDEFTYNAGISNGQSAQIAFSTIDYENPGYCSINAGNEIYFNLSLYFNYASITIGDMSFTRNTLGNATCTLNSYSGTDENVTIPETVEIDGKEYVVNEIGSYSFVENHFIKNVTLPSAITLIQEAAFRECENLEYVNIPENVLKIQNEAFADCYKLSGIRLPNNLVVIGDRAFMNAVIEELEIPKSIQSIGESAFCNCRKLKQVILPEGLKTIEWGTFLDCSLLEQIIVHAQSKCAFSND